MARVTICLCSGCEAHGPRACGLRTTNGTRCPTCAGGLRATRGGDRYADPRYRAMRDRLVEEHRRTFGPRCPRCGAREDPRIPRTRLSFNHDTTMSRPGADILGPGTVMCVGCNSRQLHVDRPDLARRGRRGRT